MNRKHANNVKNEKIMNEKHAHRGVQLQKWKDQRLKRGRVCSENHYNGFESSCI